jgi:hypothetical protein
MTKEYQAPPSAKSLDLRGAYLKIERAKKHISDLDAQRVAFLGTDPYHGIPKFNAEENCTEYILPSLPAIPDDIPLMLGDAVHNLRSALDYVACELVRSVNIEPDRAYFPISESRKKYKANSGGQTYGMPTEAKNDIDRIRPYLGGNNGFWLIHKLDIIDKHRLLVTVGMRIGEWSVNLSPTPTLYTFAIPPSFILKEGNTIGSIPGNTKTDKQMSITSDRASANLSLLRAHPLLNNSPS